MTELNLIPYELRRKKKLGYTGREMAKIALVIAGILLFAILIPTGKLIFLQNKEKALIKEISSKESQLKESEELSRKITSYKEYINMVEGILSQKQTIEDKVRTIEKYMVSDVVITNLSAGKGTISIIANSKSYSSLCVFVANLQESTEYKEARLSGINFNTDKLNYTAAITISY
ncbi:hypothetical protein Q428_01410 [Fervidicella metallireducens AeB]|uniref:Fimbrial protein n=1 Tax=Fervidicella metallireducens AeB TaxID=1403537 RepID=A0A017RY83_9CLOT|nr:PilN domain-containing protein [Fervidicella metallireducens]EYE89738.1 hypothetical protein Q428_01410 [Fervidicella metallireducens AeB]